MTTHTHWADVPFREFLTPNKRPYLLGPAEDANLVGMRWYGFGPFHREFKPGSKIQKKAHFQIRTGDVIFNKLFAWKGTFGVVPTALDGMFVSDKFPTYSLNEHKCLPGYLAWYFKYPPLWEQARKLSTGSAAVSKLTLNPPRFLDLTIPLPDTRIQRDILTKLDSINNQIDTVKTIALRSAEQSKAVFTALLRELNEKMRPTATLERVLKEKPRNGWSAKCDNADDGTPVLTLSAVTGFTYTGCDFKKTSLPTHPGAHYWLRPGDILITRSNTPELVGHAAIYDGTPTPCIYPDLMMRLLVDEQLADPLFVWIWLQTPLVRDYIQRNAKGTSPTMKKISQGIVCAIPFPETASLTDQRNNVEAILAIREQLDSVKVVQANTRSEVEALLPSILDRAFAGELV